MSLTSGTPHGGTHTVTEEHGLFARQATGLVRDITGRQAIALNFVSGLPPIGIAYGVFFALTGFPGGNVFVGILLTIPLTLAFCYVFGLLSAVIPRSGGDYMLVSRILAPWAGMISSCCMMMAVMLAQAALGIAFVTEAVAPGLSTIGYVSGSHALISAGTTVASSKAWQYGLGGVFLPVVAALAASFGNRILKRSMFVCIATAMAGIVVVCVVDLFTSSGGFASTFNHFAQPYTHLKNSYQATIAGAGNAHLALPHGFSWGDTIAMIGVMSSFGIYAYTTAFTAGEIRQGGSTKTGHRMAIGGVLALVIVGICAALFYKAWGHDFLAAGYSTAGLPKGLSVLPTYVFLSSIQVGSPVYAAVLALTFVFAFPALVIVSYLWGSRILFAWAFDGLLPQAVTKVTRRNAPIVGIWVTCALFVAVTAWAVFVSHSLVQVVVYTTLIQLIAMSLLVGVSAIALPFRRTALYRASSSAIKIANIPITVILGGAGILAGVLLYYLYFHFPYFGLTNKGNFFIWLGGTIAFALLLYFGARVVRRREGVDLDRAYAEIPPE